MRETSDIVSLLPHIMLAVIDRIDRGEQVDSIEYVYYLYVAQRTKEKGVWINSIRRSRFVHSLLVCRNGSTLGL
jgi:hypothetical protein